MKILLTNDDGIEAPGINVLAEYLERNGHQLIIVAPETEKSATSHSITLKTPLRIIKKGENRYATNGSPADSVILALQVILKEKVDLVISGINRGPNIGEDILYSGTVAAAIEAMFYKLPAIAVSLCSKTINRYDTAADFMVKMLAKGVEKIGSEKEILNINILAVPIDDIKGIKITKAGNRIYTNFVCEKKDLSGNCIYWLGDDNPKWKKDDNTDIEAIRNNYISITPLSPNFTNYKSFERLAVWSTSIGV